MSIRAILTRNILRKVPEITVLFWIIKLLTTALGESTSDFMVHTLNPIVAVLIGAVVFTFTIIVQLFVKRYIPWVYWLAVTMVAIFGTMAADVLHIGLGIPYEISTIFFAIALAVIFFLWHRTENTLSIHSITTSRRELFYWATVVTTFALGTATGDMTAVTFSWGYILSGVIFGFLFIIPLIVQKTFKVNEVLTFWLAYIFTRPFGASFADWFGRTPEAGGIGIGTGRTSIILAVLIVILVAYLSRSQRNKHTI